MQLVRFTLFYLLIMQINIACAQQIECILVKDKCFLKDKTADGIVRIINKETNEFLESKRADIQETNKIDINNELLGLAILASFSEETINSRVSKNHYLVVKYYFSNRGICLGLEFLFKEEMNFDLNNLSSF